MDNEIQSGVKPEYRMIKFLTAVVFLAGMGISIVGLMIVSELNSLSGSREAGFIEIKTDLSEIKRAHARDVSEWKLWREKVDLRLQKIEYDQQEREREKEQKQNQQQED